jgi:hypothetical protein
MDTLSADEQQTAALAFAWLDTYRALSRKQDEAPAAMSARPARTAGRAGGGTPYEIWATLTLFYVLHGFSKEVYPMRQTHVAVGLPHDFLPRVEALLARLERASSFSDRPAASRGGGGAAAASSCGGEEEEALATPAASVGY